MIESIGKKQRVLQNISKSCDFIVVGGGLSGTCCAITAARSGLKTILIQARPVLGGNASSEVRLWALGATSHMGNNNRWAREGGVVGEILEENLWRNKEGNPVLFDAILIDKALAENNLDLYLDTAVCKISCDAQRITSVQAFCSQSSILYDFSADLFCDASGDGILGYLSGADFRIGAEDKSEFDEPIATEEDFGELLGDTIFFYSKDTGAPVSYTAPDFALKDITQIPRYKDIRATEHGCSFWWLEYGGRLDTIKDNQHIKQELWKVTYGIWDYIKNSGNFPEAENLTLEWVGMIPGKRESRRFLGDYILSQKDIVEQRIHDDAVAHGGWAIDLHPADGVYSPQPPCTQYHSKGMYQIPYRCLYSRNVENLFLAGRLISSSHVAFGSTRVMLTGAVCGQAVAAAAYVCNDKGLLPAQVSSGKNLQAIKQKLQELGQFIPHYGEAVNLDIVQKADITASSTMELKQLPSNNGWARLDSDRGMLLALGQGAVPKMRVFYRALENTQLTLELHTSERPGNATPDQLLETQTINLISGESSATIAFTTDIVKAQYGLIVFKQNDHIELSLSDSRFTGLLCLTKRSNPKVSKTSRQLPPKGSGIDEFDFWLPSRRPGGENISMEFSRR
jgi:hypothetical protein